MMFHTSLVSIGSLVSKTMLAVSVMSVPTVTSGFG